MNNKTLAVLTTTLVIIPMITGCTPKTSPERHARQYIQATSDDLEPYFVVNKTDSIHMMVPFFKPFYELGRKDKAEGVSPDEALLCVKTVHYESFLNSIYLKEKMTDKIYTSRGLTSAQEQKSMGDAILGTYMDGYQGID